MVASFLYFTLSGKIECDKFGMCIIMPWQPVTNNTKNIVKIPIDICSNGIPKHIQIIKISSIKGKQWTK